MSTDFKKVYCIIKHLKGNTVLSNVSVICFYICIFQLVDIFSMSQMNAQNEWSQ